MKYALTVLMTTALLAAAPQAQKSAPPSKKAAAAPATTAAPPKRLEIPAGAVERDGRFYYTDADGKKWIYVRTPFGASRMEDTPAAYRPEVKPVDPFANVKVTEKGDTVTFERPGAFGVSKWEKKRSDLTDEEKAALRRSQEDSAKPAKVGEGSTKQDR